MFMRFKERRVARVMAALIFGALLIMIVKGLGAPLAFKPMASNAKPRFLSSGIQKADEIQARFDQRKQHLLRMCNATSFTLPVLPCTLKELETNILFMKQRDAAFCSIQKTGSTFWKRILHAAGGKAGSLYDVKVEIVDDEQQGGGFSRIQMQNISAYENALQDSLTFLFVRDPYTKIFSGWYDKLYSPNHYFWEVYGREIIRSERNSPSKESLKYGHDVLFAEFIQFIVKTLRRPVSCLDGHFTTSYQHCLPCKLDFDYIGKFETITEDTQFLLKQLNINESVLPTNIERDAKVAEIKDAVYYVFLKKQVITEGVSFRCVLLRLWTRFKGRGIIDVTREFPAALDNKAEELTEQQVTDLLLDAYHKSDQTKVHINRQEALVQAFSSLERPLLEDFQKTFKLDFDLFNYSTTAPFLDHKVEFDYLEQCTD